MYVGINKHSTYNHTKRKYKIDTVAACVGYYWIQICTMVLHTYIFTTYFFQKERKIKMLVSILCTVAAQGFLKIEWATVWLELGFWHLPYILAKQANTNPNRFLDMCWDTVLCMYVCTYSRKDMCCYQNWNYILE